MALVDHLETCMVRFRGIYLKLNVFHSDQLNLSTEIVTWDCHHRIFNTLINDDQCYCSLLLLHRPAYQPTNVNNRHQPSPTLINPTKLCRLSWQILWNHPNFTIQRKSRAQSLRSYNLVVIYGISAINPISKIRLFQVKGQSLGI